MNPGITFVLHGRLRRKDALRRRVQDLFGKDFTVAVRETQRPGDGIHLAEDAARQGSGYVVAVGGDGTVNEVVNGIMRVRGASSIAGVLPYGTGNDFAKMLGVGPDPRHLLQALQAERVQTVDVGKMTYVGRQGVEETRYFINVADVGIGGEVLQNMAKSRRWLSPNLTYASAIVQTFFSYRHKPVRLVSSEYSWEGTVLGLVMANAKYFASGLCIAPEAHVADGRLHLVVLGNVRLMDYLKNLTRVRRCVRLDHLDVHYVSVSSCEVHPLGEAVALEMDGEFVGYAPLKASILPRAMRFLVGA